MKYKRLNTLLSASIFLTTSCQPVLLQSAAFSPESGKTNSLATNPKLNNQRPRLRSKDSNVVIAGSPEELIQLMKERNPQSKESTFRIQNTQVSPESLAPSSIEVSPAVNENELQITLTTHSSFNYLTQCS